MTNIIPLCFLDEAKTEDISKLSVTDLLSLQARIDRLSAEVKRHKSILDNALELKFTDKAKSALQADGRDTGTVHFIEDHHKITADLPKKVVWDQSKLTDLIAKIPAEDRSQYIKVNYSIDERRYLMWPETLKNFFSEARTVQVGKPKFSIQED